MRILINYKLFILQIKISLYNLTKGRTKYKLLHLYQTKPYVVYELVNKKVFKIYSFDFIKGNMYNNVYFCFYHQM